MAKAPMPTLSPEQFAELERTNPQLADAIMRGVGNLNSGASGSDALSWLGADGMPTRVSSAPQPPMREQSRGKSDRGVSTDAPTPPRRPANAGTRSNAVSNNKQDVEGDTARTNARAGGGRADASAPSADGPTTREVDKSATRTAVAAAPAAAVAPAAINEMRIAHEIFGPPMPQGMNADIPTSATEGSTDTNKGLPDDVAMSAAAAGGATPVDGVTGVTAEDIARDPSLAEVAALPASADGTWREKIGQALGSPKIALRNVGIDYDALPFAERNRITLMGVDKWLAQNAARYRKPSRQQSQR